MEIKQKFVRDLELVSQFFTHNIRSGRPFFYLHQLDTFYKNNEKPLSLILFFLAHYASFFYSNGEILMSASYKRHTIVYWRNGL